METMLPKLELMAIIKYLKRFAKVLRPSITPSITSCRPLVSRMISAVSLAISTALLTEMPMSAAFSDSTSFLTPSPI